MRAHHHAVENVGPVLHGGLHQALVLGVDHRPTECARRHDLDPSRELELALDQSHAAAARILGAHVVRSAHQRRAGMHGARWPHFQQLFVGEVAVGVVVFHRLHDQVTAILEHQGGNVFIDPAPAEHIAGIRQAHVVAARRVPQHIAPVLVAREYALLGGVITGAGINPADAGLDAILECLRAHKLRVIHVAQVLQHLGLDVRGLNIVLGARHHAPINPAAALGADQPVSHRGDLVVDQRQLAACDQVLRVLFVPLNVVVEVAIGRHLQAVFCLAVALHHPPAQQLLVGGQRFLPIKRMRRAIKLGAIGVDQPRQEGITLGVAAALAEILKPAHAGTA